MSANKTPSDAPEVSVYELWPVQPGTGRRDRGSTEKVIVARESDKKDGAEITWVRARRAFRVDWFQNGKRIDTFYVLEHQVRDYTER